jgi:hypothetical protein
MMSVWHGMCSVSLKRMDSEIMQCVLKNMEPVLRCCGSDLPKAKGALRFLFMDQALLALKWKSSLCFLFLEVHLFFNQIRVV